MEPANALPAPIDWYGSVRTSARRGRLGAFLVSLPRNRWSERDEIGRSLLDFACWGDNVDAVATLLAHGLSVQCADHADHWSPAQTAAHFAQARVLEVLCAAGATLRAPHDAPLELALRSPASAECARVLVANGVRLHTAQRYRRNIGVELVALERGVLRCRAAAVAFLSVKRVGKLVGWDRFLLAALAPLVWATRSAHQWQYES